MGTTEPETPNRQRWPDWLQSSLRTVALVALVLIAVHFVWRGLGWGRVGRAVRGVQELTPKAEKRNQEITELASPPAGKQDK